MSHGASQAIATFTGMKVLLSESPTRPYRPRHRRPVPWMPPKLGLMGPDRHLPPALARPAMLVRRHSSRIPKQAAAWLRTSPFVGKP
jgi:hypothetical protein